MRFRQLAFLLVATVFAGRAQATIVYDNLPSTPWPSLGYTATQTTELGDYIVLGGSDRQFTGATVPMASFTPSNLGAPYQIALTLNIYAVDLSGTNPAVGMLLGSMTSTFDIPASPGPNLHTDFTVHFDATSLNLMLPNQLIWSLSFSAPNGVPQSSLNQAVQDTTGGLGPSVGSFGEAGYCFWATNNPAYGGNGTFQRSNVLDPYKPAIQIDAIPEPSTVALIFLSGGVLLVRRTKFPRFSKVIRAT